jgi:DNA polymerase elongation subunit (family B)
MSHEVQTITIKKVKKNTVVKSFRLLDFHIYDERKTNEKSTSSEESVHKFSRKDEAQFMIQMFGINEEGETCCIYVNDFQPFFFVKVGDDWTQRNVNGLLSEIKKMIGAYYEASIVSAELVDKHKLYGFSGGKMHKFIKLTFKNTTSMNRVKNLWYDYGNGEPGESRKMKKFLYPPKTGISLELYESNIPPVLRYFHIHNISPSGWVYIPVDKVFKPPIKSTTCKYEYLCMANQLKPIGQKETRVPYKICSFDIEASSSHGDFPLPKKTYKRLAMNIVDCFYKQSQNQSIDLARASALIQKLILTAFGFDHFDDIDLVYPKQAPSKEQIKQLVQKMLEMPIQAVKKDGGDNSDLLTIDSIFDQIKDFHSNNNVVYEGKEGDDEEDDDAGLVDAPKFTYKKTTKKASINKKTNILDVLLDSEREREEKIQSLNEIMTIMFPRLEGDKTTFIGSTFLKYGETEPYLNHCVVLGTCDNVAGVEIVSVDKERDLLLAWTELIQKENPDIIIGYNIFGFDYEFMFRRAEENHCEREFLKLSRKMGELSAKESKDGVLSIENTKIVLASGEYDLRYPKINGRLQIDMYAYFRRDFNLSSYKLDDVAGQFISDDVKKIENAVHPVHGDVTELYSQNLMGLHVGDFIHIEVSSFTSDYYKNGKKFPVIDIVRGREVTEMVKGTETKVKYNVIVIAGHEAEYIDMKKSIKWGMAKDDVTPQDIFRLADRDASGRAIVAKYCIQDCNLVHHLMNKIDVITGYVEMSRICSVPISFLVFRGQGIKLTSFVAKKCREKNTLMPDLEKSGGNEGYEGAIVLPPKCSMYMDNPVACVDYSSLYPSSMISQNLSHDSKVWTKEFDLQGNLIKQTGEKDTNGNYIYDNMPGYDYIDLEFDTFKYLRNPAKPSAKAEKTKTGTMICRWAQFPDNKKGIMPSILEELLKARSDTRKMIKTEKDPFMQNILDKRQLGYKVTANSLYGQCGAKTSTFYEKDVAASTTATGRMMIIYAKRIIEEVYGNLEYETEKHGPVMTKAEYVYGDSVASYTPVLIRYKDHFMNTFVCDLHRRCGNDTWTTCIEEGKQSKEYCELVDTEVWSDKGWTKIHRVIRHKLANHKKMVRVITDNGIVDVTDDHSLLLSNSNEISPKDCQIGTELLHHSITNESCCLRNLPNDLSANTHVEYDLNDYTRFPGEVYAQFSKMLSAGKIHQGQHITIRQRASENRQLISALVYTVFATFNINLKTAYSLYRDEYVMTYVPNDTPYDNKIKKLIEIPYDDYVYDLTTDNHHFAAGIGNMIVHNTDSVFFTFNLEDPKTGQPIRGKDALEITIEIAQDAAHLCTQWLKPPMELSYEKTLMPFVLLSKKRYVGMLYETDPNKGKMKYMGLSLKRRDSCDYLKDTYGGILNILMKEHNISKSIDFLNLSLQNLIDGKVSMDKLMITKALRSDYKNPQQIAHRVLADRIGQRDPGNKPKPGDRMRFVHIVSENKHALQGEKIETPEFILDNKLPIDYTFYITNQLMKPLQQLFGLALEQIWDFQGKKSAISAFRREIAKLEKEFPDLEVYMKKREKLCSTKIKALLFEKFLTKIFNQKHGIQEISGFFTKRV